MWTLFPSLGELFTYSDLFKQFRHIQQVCFIYCTPSHKSISVKMLISVFCKANRYDLDIYKLLHLDMKERCHLQFVVLSRYCWKWLHFLHSVFSWRAFRSKYTYTFIVDWLLSCGKTHVGGTTIFFFIIRWSIGVIFAIQRLANVINISESSISYPIGFCRTRVFICFRHYSVRLIESKLSFCIALGLHYL